LTEKITNKDFDIPFITDHPLGLSIARNIKLMGEQVVHIGALLQL
jgi:hypothetical protein